MRRTCASSAWTSRCGSSSSSTSAICSRVIFGTSFGQYPASVNSLIAAALPWSLVLQVPAILIGWIVGNVLGAIAAFKGGWFDRGAFLGSLFMTSIPYYCLAILLLYVFAVQLGLFPVGGGLLLRTHSGVLVGVLRRRHQLLLVAVLVAGAGLHRRPGRRHAVDGDLRAGLRLRQLRPWTRPEGRHHHPLRLPQRHAAPGHRTGAVDRRA